MKRPPRDPKERLFSLRAVSVSVLQGASVLALVLGVFVVARFIGGSEAYTRAQAFTTLVVANLGLILTNRSWSRTIIATMKMPNKALWWVLGGATAFLAIALYVPWPRDLFRFESLNARDVAICVVAGVVSILWFEGLKILKRTTSKAAALSN